MPIRVKIKDRSFTSAINQLKNRAENRRPLMESLSGIMHDAVEENFEQEGRPAWQDLKQKTKDARARKNKWPGKILQVSGQLVNSIQSQATENEAVVFTNKEYAAAHQFGYEKNNLPARPFLSIPDETIEEMRDEVISFLTKGFL